MESNTCTFHSDLLLYNYLFIKDTNNVLLIFHVNENIEIRILWIIVPSKLFQENVNVQTSLPIEQRNLD
jgi:predicted nucleotidyltransferase